MNYDKTMRICEVCQKPTTKTVYLEAAIAPVVRASGLAKAECEDLLGAVQCKPSYLKSTQGTADLCPTCSLALSNEITATIAEKLKEVHAAVSAIVDRVRGCIVDHTPDNTIEFNRVAEMWGERDGRARQ